jgi:Spy/CpxP family protein refolding chaperone
LSDAKSRKMPKRLADKYEEAQRDPELLSARSDVAFLEARLGELMERLSSGESNEIWDDLHKTLARFEESAEEDADKIIRTVKLIVERGRTDEAVWRQLHEVIEQKTKVAASEWKRLVDMKQVITAEKAMAFSMQLLEIVLRHTPEPERRRRIAGEIQGLMNVQGRRRSAEST